MLPFLILHCVSKLNVFGKLKTKDSERKKAKGENDIFQLCRAKRSVCQIAQILLFHLNELFSPCCIANITCCFLE